jgi:protein-L-isoaspartate(D-aspartate) O-methyltransferase
MMVDGQVRTSDVTDPAIIAAMLDVPRERFVPENMRALAYADLDLPATADPQGRRLLKPMVLAKLVQAAEIGGGDRVLDVAGGSGYSAALLSRLARAVIALEDDPVLAARGRDTLVSLGVANVEVVTGPLSDGWGAGAPYDVVLVNGAFEVPPNALLRQLRSGARLVGISGRAPAGKAVRYVSTNGQVSAVPIFDAAAPLLSAFAKPPAFVF